MSSRLQQLVMAGIPMSSCQSSDRHRGFIDSARSAKKQTQVLVKRLVVVVSYLLIHIPGNPSESCCSRQAPRPGSPAEVWAVLLGDKKAPLNSQFTGTSDKNGATVLGSPQSGALVYLCTVGPFHRYDIASVSKKNLWRLCNYKHYAPQPLITAYL